MGINFLPLLGVGAAGATVAAASTQQFQFENIPGKNGAQVLGYSNGTLSISAVNIPNYISFNKLLAIFSESNAGSATIHFGLYSMNGSTLSLANSASAAITMGNAFSWHSFATSATQNIAPGPWYFAFNVLSGGASSLSMFGNSSVNPNNAFPALVAGRMTVSTNAMPGSIATSDLDITGSDATRQPYILISA